MFKRTLDAAALPLVPLLQQPCYQPLLQAVMSHRWEGHVQLPFDFINFDLLSQLQCMELAGNLCCISMPQPIKDSLANLQHL